MQFCESDDEAIAFVAAKKAIINDAARIDATIILLIDLVFLLWQLLMSLMFSLTFALLLDLAFLFC